MATLIGEFEYHCYFFLLVAGTYLLISDLAKEQHRGTLKFIQLSPQTAGSILVGKILGVPVLIYLAVGLMIPFHLWAGISAHISVSQIFIFYGIITASCLFFYSAAIFYQFTSYWFSGFQSWLFSGAVFGFLYLTIDWANPYRESYDPLIVSWFKMFSPFDILYYLFLNGGNEYASPVFRVRDLQWFFLPVGTTTISLVGFTLLNYGLWTYWIWQALKRSFRNPNATILSKKQSYWFVFCFEVVMVGFVLHQPQDLEWFLFDNLRWFPLFNAVLFFGLIAMLSPQRQTLQDWARYQKDNSRQKAKGTTQNLWLLPSKWQDAIFGEKSPAVVAIAINLGIATTIVMFSIFLGLQINHINDTDLLGTFFLGLVLFVSLMMIYATLAQLMLLMKTPKRSLWAAGTIAVAIFLPPLLSVVFEMKNSILWLFSLFPWRGITITHLDLQTITVWLWLALLSRWTVLVLLNLQLNRQLRMAGESTLKVFVGDRSSLSPSLKKR